MTSLRQRISLPTFERIRGLYLTRFLIKNATPVKVLTQSTSPTRVIPPSDALLLLSFFKSGIRKKESQDIHDAMILNYNIINTDGHVLCPIVSCMKIFYL